MLPQFGYIVAQAGADSRAPPPSTAQVPLQKQTSVPPPPYMYSTTSIAPPMTAPVATPTTASSQVDDYHSHYYSNSAAYNRVNSSSTELPPHINNSSTTGASFRPLQQAPPRQPPPSSSSSSTSSSAATAYPWQPHDSYMDHPYRVAHSTTSPAATATTTAATSTSTSTVPKSTSSWHITPPTFITPPHPPPPPQTPSSTSSSSSKSTTVTATKHPSTSIQSSNGISRSTIPHHHHSHHHNASNNMNTNNNSNTNVYLPPPPPPLPQPPSSSSSSSTTAHDVYRNTPMVTPGSTMPISAGHYGMTPAPLPSLLSASAPTTHDLVIKEAAMYDAPTTYYVKQPLSSRWHQDDTSEVNESKMLRRLREYNELMTWMDNEFWEQNDEVYQEKLQSLQKELRSIQEGDHAAFQELVADLEIIRDQTIENALLFENYQLTMTKQEFDMDVMLIEDEFQNEMHHLNEMIMLVIDEHRKQIKDDREDNDQLDIDGIFQEAYARIKQKRSLRKRTMNNVNSNGERASPVRQETSSRGRRLKNAVTLHNINAQMTAKEEEDVETEFLMMKGILPKRNGASSRR